MADILKYRLPEGRIIEQVGFFEERASLIDAEGFIVSDFKKSKYYCFVESKGTSQFSYLDADIVSLSKEEYLTQGQIFLQELRSNGISKAVYSRIKKVKTFISPSDIFDALCTSYPNTFVYLISSPEFGTWIGATPERLVEGNVESFKTMALAGTLSNDSSESWSDKEINEQRLVSDYIIDKMRAENIQILKKQGPEESYAGPVKHLKTDFELKTDAFQLIQIAELLHPTPAVSGLPQDKALELIQQVEKHERSLYAGFIGLVGKKSSNLFVNLRCAQMRPNSIYLYLGGGYTSESSVVDEWVETEYKAKTLMQVIRSLEQDKTEFN